MSVADILEEPFLIHGILPDRSDRRRRVASCWTWSDCRRPPGSATLTCSRAGSASAWASRERWP